MDAKTINEAAKAVPEKIQQAVKKMFGPNATVVNVDVMMAGAKEGAKAADPDSRKVGELRLVVPMLQASCGCDAGIAKMTRTKDAYSKVCLGVCDELYDMLMAYEDGGMRFTQPYFESYGHCPDSVSSIAKMKIEEEDAAQMDGTPAAEPGPVPAPYLWDGFKWVPNSQSDQPTTLPFPGTHV